MKNSNSDSSTNLWQRCAVLTVAVLAFALTSAYGQQGDFPPSVAVPAISPSAVAASDSPLTITVNVKISYPDGVSLLPGSVYLLDASGDGPPVVLAQLNDDGVNGDITAGDSIFGGTAQLTVASPRLILLKAQATFSNDPNPVISSIGTVEVFDPSVPFQFQIPNISSSNTCTHTDENGDHDELCDEILMLFRPGSDFSIVQSAAQSVNATVSGLAGLPELNIWQLSVPCKDDGCVQDAVNNLNQEAGSSGYSGLVGGEADFLKYADAGLGDKTRVPKDPYYSLQWGARKVLLPLAWGITTGNFVSGGTPLIAIVDSGIDKTHPDLAGKVQLGSNFGNKNGDASNDECGHGTAVAGVAGAIGDNGIGIAGASWVARLLAIKVMVPDGAGKCETDEADEIKAFDEAVKAGASVINFSTSDTAKSAAEKAAVKRINDADRLLVDSTGNNGKKQMRYPAAYDFTRNLSVGGTVRDDTVDPESGHGPWVRIYAPDVCILTTVAKGQPIAKAGDKCLDGAAAPVPAARLNYKEGTSFATPLVAGIASLMRGVNPKWSMSQIRMAITAWGDDIPDPDDNTKKVKRVNAFRSVRCAATGLCQ